MKANENPNFYAVIPANVRYSRDLSAQEKLLYAEITALSNSKGYCWASNNYFAELFCLRKETVSKQISKLVKLGFLKSEIKYFENSKQIEVRRLYIASNSLAAPIDENISTPIDENINTPIAAYEKTNTPIDNKISTPVDENVNTPIDENIKGNIINTNTTRDNIYNLSNPVLSKDESMTEVVKREKNEEIANDISDYKATKEKIKSNIEYDYFLKARHPHIKTIDKILRIMLGVIVSRNETVQIKDSILPREAVVDVLWEINSGDIENILHNLKSYSKPIGDEYKFFLSALYKQRSGEYNFSEYC